MLARPFSVTLQPMNIKELVKKVILSETATLGGEDVTFSQGEIISMIGGQHSEEMEIYGGERPEKQVNLSCSAGRLPSYVKTGEMVNFRGEQWKIQRVSYGVAMEEIGLVDPFRVE